MKKFVAKYPVGKELPVYYNPNNPEKAVLERGFFPDFSEFFILFGGAFFFLMGLGMVLPFVTGILDRIINLFF